MMKVLVGVILIMLTACGGNISPESLTKITLLILFTSMPVLVIAVLASILVLAGMLFSAMDTVKIKWKRSCEKQIRNGLIKTDLDWDDLQHLGERWHLNRMDLLGVLRTLHALAVSGEDEYLTKKLPEIRSLLRKYQELEPYSELPENISIQLTELTVTAPQHASLVRQLATSLNELYAKNQRQISKQRKIAIWSFIMGIAGIILAIISIYLAFAPVFEHKSSLPSSLSLKPALSFEGTSLSV